MMMMMMMVKMELNKNKQVDSLGYYRVRNFAIYTGNIVLLT
jgi:hypothetical protein